MKPPCEVTVSHILPFIRALVSRRLVEGYGLSQSLAAKKLGMSQPAISQYRRELRGSRAKLKEYPKLLDMVNSIAKGVSDGSLSPEQTTLEFCKICKYLKLDGVICKLHRDLYPSLESCNICIEE
jgi:predicted transcriptional regulator